MPNRSVLRAPQQFSHRWNSFQQNESTKYFALFSQITCCCASKKKRWPFFATTRKTNKKPFLAFLMLCFLSHLVFVWQIYLNLNSRISYATCDVYVCVSWCINNVILNVSIFCWLLVAHFTRILWLFYRRNGVWFAIINQVNVRRGENKIKHKKKNAGETMNKLWKWSSFQIYNICVCDIDYDFGMYLMRCLSSFRADSDRNMKSFSS